MELPVLKLSRFAIENLDKNRAEVTRKGDGSELRMGQKRGTTPFFEARTAENPVGFRLSETVADSRNAFLRIGGAVGGVLSGDRPLVQSVRQRPQEAMPDARLNHVPE